MSSVVFPFEKEGDDVGLHRFALFTACCTAFLIFVGGLVTSTESGLSVPDWPTTYGWNMFDFARIARSYSESPKAVRPTTAHVATGGAMMSVRIPAWK